MGSDSAFGEPEMDALHDTSGCFNVSNSEAHALYGVSHGCAIGVDLEEIRPLPDVSGITAFFSARENQVLPSLPAAPASRHSPSAGR